MTLKFQDGSSTDVESESPMEIPTTTVEKFESLKESQIIEFQVTEGDKNHTCQNLAKAWICRRTCRYPVATSPCEAWKARQRDNCGRWYSPFTLLSFRINFCFGTNARQRAREHLERQLQSANEARVMKEEMQENRENAKKKKKKRGERTIILLRSFEIV